MGRELQQTMIQAVVFDLDHTLFDRYETLRLVVPRFKDCFKINEGITDEFIYKEICWADKQYVHLGWEKILKHLSDKNIFKEIPSFEEYTQYLVSQFRVTAVEYIFTKPMLEKLRKQGYKLGIITNGNSITQHKKIELLGLSDYVDEIIVAGDEKFDKPEPEIFCLMAERLNIKPEEMMYVGDNPLNDVEGSRRAGCLPVWVKTTGTWIFPEIEKPKLQVETVEEMPELLAIIKR